MKAGVSTGIIFFGFVFCMCVSARQGVAGENGMKDSRQIPVFGDDFSAVGLFVENWESSKDVHASDGRAVIPAGNNMKLRRIPEGNFAFSADLIFEEPHNGHAGATLDGIHFMIYPRGTGTPTAQTAYRLPGEERSRGTSRPLPDFEFGKPNRLAVSREKVGDLYKYAYSLNGVAVDSFTAGMPVNNRISFYGYRTDMAVDNFQLYSLGESDGSSNLAVNSSFEHLQEGMPNYMKPRLGGCYSFGGHWLDYLKFFAIDAAEKFHGKQSVRMTAGTAPGAPTSNGFGTHNVNIVSGTPVTFSVYLKASEDSFPVTLHIWELHHRNHSRNITVSKEWERYSFTVDNPERATVRGNVTFARPGTLWADAVQVEIGSETTPYMGSPLDRDKFDGGAEEAKVIPEDIVPGRMPKPPVIDGVLEDAWFRHGAKTDAFFLRGWDKPVNRTEAYLAYDNDNLYIAVRAYVPDVTNIAASEHERDNLRVHSDECIEILLDTTFNRQSYYHLTMNAAGSKTDFGPGRLLAWNGDWQGAVQVNRKTGSVDYEFRIPFVLFTDLNIAGRWGLNIGRNDKSAGNVNSLIRTAQVNFHLPDIFPAIAFPEGVMESYRVGFRSLKLMAAGGSRFGVSGMVGNRGSGLPDAEIRILDRKSGEVLGTRRVALGRGDTEFLVPVDIGEDVSAVDAVVSIVVNGQPLITRTERMVLLHQLEMYTRYNYYMNEDAAVLAGSLRLPDADKLTGRITVGGKTFSVIMEPEFAFDIPLEGIGNGEHRIIMDIYRGTEKVVSGTAGLVRREFKAGAAQIDRQRRCLVVDGKPYLVIAPFFGMPRGVSPEDREKVAETMLRHHMDAGYRSLMPGAVDDPPVRELAQAFLDLCARKNIKSVFWPFRSWNQRERETPEERLRMVQSNDIIAWLVIDEPELYAKSDEVERFLEAYMEASPYTPVFMNNTVIGIPGRFANLKTDILMIDDYLTNREGRKVVEMLDAADMMWEAGREERKPVFYFLAGENLHNHYREPTYEEQIAQTYGVIIAGATGISYFLSLAYYPEHYRALVDVNRELLELEDAILSLERTPDASVANPLVRLMTRRLGGSIYVIALNADNERTAETEIVLPSGFEYADTAVVKFEDRRIKVNNGRIYDTFKPLERHVYVVEVR